MAEVRARRHPELWSAGVCFPPGQMPAGPLQPQWREPEEGFGLLLSISTAPRTDVLGPSLELLPAALRTRLPHHQPAPGGETGAPRGRRGPSGAVRPLGRPLGRRRAGRNGSRLVGSAERANLEGPACVRPAGSQGAPRPRASGAMGPPSLGVDPPRGLCPPRKARHPLTSGDGVGPAWPEPRRSSCPCAFRELPHRRSHSTSLLGGLQARQRGFRASLHTPARCALVFPGGGRLSPGVQDRSAGRDFLDGGEAAGSVMPLPVSGTEGRVAGPGPPAYLSCDLRLPRWAVSSS